MNPVCSTTPSERHPPSRAGGTRLADRLLALLRDDERDRSELAGLLSLSEKQVATTLAELADDVVSEDGRVRLKAPAAERRPRRFRSPEHLRLAGERRANDADEQPEVAAVRSRLLGDELLCAEEVPAWLEEKSRSGERVEHITTCGTVIHRERPTVDYAGPDDVYARRVSSTSELEPLRLASVRLATRYGWQPAQATVFVLTGTVPVSGVRVTTRRTLPSAGAPSRWTVEFDADEDAQIVADEIRGAQKSLGVPRRPKLADAEKQSRLAAFVSHNGTGESALVRWNNEYPDDRYKSRQTFWQGARRATSSD